MATRGRPSVYTPELAAAVCRQLASGKTLRVVCREEGMPPESTVREWAMDDREGFAAQYSRAREIGYHAMFDEMLEIADDSRRDVRELPDGTKVIDYEEIQRSRLRVDTRKFALAKGLPKIYGDRIATQTLGKDGQPVDPGGIVMMIDMGNGPQTAAQIAAERDQK